MTGPIPLSPMARALRPRPRNTAPAAAALPPAQEPYYGGGTDVENQSRGGKSYGEMTPGEFNQEAQNRANRSMIERNLPTIIAPLGIGTAMQMWDNNMFAGEQAQRAQDFAAKGQSMPDEAMAAAYGGGKTPGGAPGGGFGVPGATPSSMQGSFSEFNDIAAEKAALDAEIAAAEALGQAGDPTMGGGVGVDAADLGAEPNAPGMFADGGMVRRSDLGGPNPPGPDEGYAALSPGEVVVNQSQQQRMGPQARSAMMRALHGGRR